MTTLLGIIALAIATLSYGLYFRDIYRGRTKPHGFTWFIWAILNGLIFYQQLSYGAGPGAWITGFAALANLFIFSISFTHGHRSITRFDWLCLGLSLIAVVVWIYSPDPALSVILVSVVFLVGLFPTFRKSLISAHEETAITYALNGTKFLIAIFALETLSLTTLLYPIVLVVANTFFAIFLFTRQSSAFQRGRSPAS